MMRRKFLVRTKCPYREANIHRLLRRRLRVYECFLLRKKVNISVNKESKILSPYHTLQLCNRTTWFRTTVSGYPLQQKFRQIHKFISSRFEHAKINLLSYWHDCDKKQSASLYSIEYVKPTKHVRYLWSKMDDNGSVLPLAAYHIRQNKPIDCNAENIWVSFRPQHDTDVLMVIFLWQPLRSRKKWLLWLQRIC